MFSTTLSVLKKKTQSIIHAFVIYLTILPININIIVSLFSVFFFNKILMYFFLIIYSYVLHVIRSI